MPWGVVPGHGPRRCRRGPFPPSVCPRSAGALPAGSRRAPPRPAAGAVFGRPPHRPAPAEVACEQACDAPRRGRSITVVGRARRTVAGVRQHSRPARTRPSARTPSSSERRGPGRATGGDPPVNGWILTATLTLGAGPAAPLWGVATGPLRRRVGARDPSCGAGSSRGTRPPWSSAPVCCSSPRAMTAVAHAVREAGSGGPGAQLRAPDPARRPARPRLGRAGARPRGRGGHPAPAPRRPGPGPAATAPARSGHVGDYVAGSWWAPGCRAP